MTYIIIEVIKTTTKIAKAIQRTIGFQFVTIKQTAQIAISKMFMIAATINVFLEISITTFL